MLRKRDNSVKVVKHIADSTAIKRDVGGSKKKLLNSTGSTGTGSVIPQEAQLTPINLPSSQEVLTMTSVTAVADLLLTPSTPTNNDQFTPDLDLPAGGARGDLVNRDTPTARYTLRVVRANAPVYIAMYAQEAQIGMSQVANVVAWALM